MDCRVKLIALGANLPTVAGPPVATLVAALAALEPRGVEIVARSRWYGTPAYPTGSGPDFVNGAAALATDLAPAALLDVLHEVERELGRDRRKRWAPRTCDLDLLACCDILSPDRATVNRWMCLESSAQAVESPRGLVLPHPRLHERGFVLRPLADIAPDWVHPVLGIDVAAMLAALPGDALADVRPLDDDPA